MHWKNKPNIYTSIQCVVSRGVTLGQHGEKAVGGDRTQWGIQSLFLFKSSQNDKRVRVDSLVSAGLQTDELPYKAYFYNNGLKELQAGPEKRKKKGLEIQHQLKRISQDIHRRTEEQSGAATFPPTVDWVDYKQA